MYFDHSYSVVLHLKWLISRRYDGKMGKKSIFSHHLCIFLSAVAVIRLGESNFGWHLAEALGTGNSQLQNILEERTKNKVIIQKKSINLAISLDNREKEEQISFQDRSLSASCMAYADRSILNLDMAFWGTMKQRLFKRQIL